MLRMTRLLEALCEFKEAGGTVFDWSLGLNFEMQTATATPRRTTLCRLYHLISVIH